MSNDFVSQPCYSIIKVVMGGILIKVERAQIKDHGIVSELLLKFAENQGWHAEIDRDRWDRVLAELLNSDGWLFLIAWEGEDPVGLAAVNFYLSLYGSREQARLQAIIVRSEHRRQKIGTRLVDEVLKAARRRGCREIEAGVESYDSDTLSFCSNFDFEQKVMLTLRCV